jgi:hypothetical protein
VDAVEAATEAVPRLYKYSVALEVELTTTLVIDNWLVPVVRLAILATT